MDTQHDKNGASARGGSCPPDDGRIRLRALEPEDVDRVYLWENLPGMREYGGVVAPLSRHQIWEYAMNYDANPLASGQLRLIVEVRRPSESEGEGVYVPCGMIDLYDIDARNRRGMVGIMIAPQFRGLGIGAGALAELERYCAGALALRELGAEVATDNEVSAALFRGAGYSEVGRRPRWYVRRDGYAGAVMLQKDITPQG